MIPSREHDEALLQALHMLRDGASLRAAAIRIRRDPTSLGRAVRKVMSADIEQEGDLPAILQHYPRGFVR